VTEPTFVDRHKSFNGKSAAAKVGLETAGLGIAEMLSSATSVGVFAYADKIFPGTVKDVTDVVVKIIEPHLDTVEKTIGAVCRLEECKPDYTKSRHERAEKMAHNLVLFGAAFVPSIIVKLATRRGINELVGLGDQHKWWKVWRLNKHDGTVFLWDEGIHIGSMILLNTGTAKFTDKLIKDSTPLIQKIFGVSETKAHDIASMTMIWELPNMLGLIAGTGAIAHKHLWSSEAKKNITAAAKFGNSGPAFGH
jgi:hypothetical protein